MNQQWRKGEASKVDFKRIQWLLVFFFLVFNIYLAFMLYDRVNTYDTQTNQQEATTIESDLLARGVVFENFSEDQPKYPLLKTSSAHVLAQNMKQLKNQKPSIDNDGVLTSELDEPLDVGLDLSEGSNQSPEEQMELLNKNFLSKGQWVLRGELYAYCRYYPEDHTLLLRMHDAKGHQIADGTAELRLEFDENSKLIFYSQTYQEDIIGLDSEVEIIPERTAITIVDKRVETVIPDHANIISSQITYYQSSALQDFNIYSPAWEFTYQEENGITRSILFDAVRGSVISRGR